MLSLVAGKPNAAIIAATIALMGCVAILVLEPVSTILVVI
jgi:hypothetical protein